jgi:hypothetical protein
MTPSAETPVAPPLVRLWIEGQVTILWDVLLLSKIMIKMPRVCVQTPIAMISLL